MLSIQAWIKTLAAVSPNYLLGVCVPLARFLFCIVSSLIVALTVLYCTQRREPHLIFLLLPRREFVTVQAGVKTHAAVSPNYLLGACVPLARFLFFDCVLSFMSVFFCCIAIYVGFVLIVHSHLFAFVSVE